MERFLNKLLLKTEDKNTLEQKHFIYAESKWTEEGLFMNIYNGVSNKTYKAEVTADDFGRSATELDIPFKDFYLECKEALTANIRLPPFEYEINDDEQKLNLIKSDKFPVVYLEVPLKLLSNNNNILDAAIEMVNDLRMAKNDVLKTAKKDDSVTKELLDELNHCKQEKEELEQKLFRKFLALLNSKKDMISKYKDELQKRSANNIDFTSDDQEDNNEIDQSADNDFNALTQVDDDNA